MSGRKTSADFRSDNSPRPRIVVDQPLRPASAANACLDSENGGKITDITSGDNIISHSLLVADKYWFCLFTTYFPTGG